MAHVTARLCRLLRNEVEEQIGLGSPGLTALAADWRKLLFPEASDEQFADGYAQAVTFGLLIARSHDIGLAEGVHEAARELRKTNSLIGAALGLLTDDEANQTALETSLTTLRRVLDVVNWHTISKDKADAWLYFYEDFLEVYDNRLRKQTGSYYTPPEVVGAMVRLVDEALRGPLFERSAGLASADVTVADPAMGTGTFLLGVFRRIADTVAGDEGAGSTAAAIRAAAKRVIGFEIQFGPFAVAQLRLIAEMQALMKNAGASLPALRLFVTDTLGNPFIEEEGLLQAGAIAQSRREANAVKRKERITVVIGNPPYKVDAAGLGGWIEEGSDGRPSALDLWMPPPEWGVGASAKHLKNLYVYFWRWATWKVFGSGWHATTGEPDQNNAGLICFITASGFLNGPGFEKMRDDLRRECDEIWVVNCSPEGHQPEVATRIFQGVQQELCIVLAARTLDKDRSRPARLRFTALPEGRQKEKFEALSRLSLDGPEWAEGPAGWREPFLPEHSATWAAFVPLPSLFLSYSPGVKTHRTWVIAPDAQSLGRRWEILQGETDPAQMEQLFHPDRDRTLDKVVKVNLGTHITREIPIREDEGGIVDPVRYAFRSFDRQWIIPDHRLLSQGRSKLWEGYSQRQVYLTAVEDQTLSAGPALTFAGEIPDQHHYNGRGGRAYPLWADRAATEPNVSLELLGYLAVAYGRPVGAADVMAYIAAVMAHPAFTLRYQKDLVRPGLRLPLTADAALFAEAVTLGGEVIWLHCYGERFTNAAAGRPKAPPRLPKDVAPFIPVDGAIPSAPEPLPDDMDYDAGKQRLVIGKGHIDNVTPAMWGYEISGKNVLRQWFSYRRRDRSKPIIGDRRPPSPLDKVQPDGWLAEYTSDLLDLLNLLGRLVLLEPKQADLLTRVADAELITAEKLALAGVLAEADGTETPG